MLILLLNALTEIAKPSEKLQLKRKISSPEKTSKRNKISTATAPIASGT